MSLLNSPMMLRVSRFFSSLLSLVPRGLFGMLKLKLGFQTTICSYGTDVPYLRGDHKKYLYGPGSILVAHGDHEYVLKSDLFEAVEGYKRLIQESLNPARRPLALVEEVVAAEVVVAIEEPIPEVVINTATVVEAELEGKMETVKKEKAEREGKQITAMEEL